jgi:hypothetical protein
MPQYQPGVPTGTVNLDVDYQNIQDNFQQLEIAYGGDHVPFSDNSGLPPGGISGMHKIIHIQSNAAPAAIANVGQFFNTSNNDGINTDTSLFYLTGGNRSIRLTRNFVPVTTNNANRNGYTFLPGGVILQWGFVTGSAANTVAVLFATNNINFPNACFNVNVIPIRAASSPGSDFSTVVVTSSVSATGFTIGNVGSHTMAGWYWQALGN